MELTAIGWTPTWEALLQQRAGHVHAGSPTDGCRAGRVVRCEAMVATVWTERDHGGTRTIEDSLAHLPARMRTGDDRPVVGDWVTLVPDHEDLRVLEILPRATCFVRRAAGRKHMRQVVAANVDVVFVVSSLDHDWNPRRLERYLTAVRESGARPIVLLTKAAVCDDAEPFLRTTHEVAPGVPVHVLDVLAGIGTEAVREHLVPGRTAALVGSSGVGKSTLVNHWLGEARQATSAVRERDERGQHTTTRRELFALPNGALVIDTPGMRELGLWADPEALLRAFSDVEALAAACRFADCGHRSEPDCAVRAAVETQRLPADRFASYVALREELEASTSTSRRRGRGISPSTRDRKRRE